MQQMDRRDVMRALAALAGTAAFSGCAPVPGASPVIGADGRRKNVLFIAIDDMRPMIGSYGAPMIQTPHIDALAREALSFDNAYIQVATCGASRGALFSALRPERTGMVTHKEEISVSAPGAPTFHGSFKDAGYHTVSHGKVLHVATDAIEGWSEKPFGMKKQSLPGVPKEMGDSDNIRDMDSVRIWREDAAKYGKARRQPAWEAADVPDTDYRDAALAEVTAKKIAELAAAGKPFFMAHGVAKPHLPFNAPKKYWDLYDRDAIPLPALMGLPEGAPDYTVAIPGEISNYSGIPRFSRENPLDEASVRLLTHGYMACVSYIDAAIGRLLKAVKDAGIWDDTIICLWGDHGFKLGEYGAWTKHTVHEIDSRIPLILRVPGLADNGARTDALVETVDIMPTLLDLNGIAVPTTLEGISILPLLKDRTRPWKTATFNQFPRNVGGEKLMGYSVRTRTHRYATWKRLSDGKVMAQELYDLRTDPGETRNLANDPAHAALVKQLAALRERGWQAGLPPTV